MAKTYRLSQPVEGVLEELAASEGRPYARVLADALRIYQLYAETIAKGGRLEIKHRNGHRTELRVLL